MLKLILIIMLLEIVVDISKMVDSHEGLSEIKKKLITSCTTRPSLRHVSLLNK
jgi:hypothetical protein